MRHLKAVCSSFAFLALSLPAQAAGGHQTPGNGNSAATVSQATELAGVAEAVDRVAKTLSLDGAGLSVVRANQELHRSLHGSFSAEQVLPIASASKWLAVATILTLVDDGTLDLDLPVSRYVKEFEGDEHRRLTLRQCLSCVSGLPARMGERMNGWDMQRFAVEAADEAMRSYPGTSFLYGGVSFQIVAVAAERATGKNWHQLFAERIGNRLGMRDTSFGSLQPIAADPGKAKLPWVAGGAVSTLNDYTRFVRMLLAKGEWHGHRVLSEASVGEMLRDQVPTIIDVKTTYLATQHVRYGLGTWIEQLQDGVVRISDPGAFGFTPWIDADLQIGGVFAVQDIGAKVRRQLSRVQEVVREAVQSPAVAGTSETIRLKHDGRDRRYHLHVPPHQQNHAGMPLLLVLHGGGGNGEQVRETTGLDKLGIAQGFVVAFPDGTGRLPKKLLTWNSGGIDVYASRNKVDDVGFLRDVVLDIQQKVPIHPGRIYVVGHSNGGMMCHRLAREAADVFAGIAVVEGAMNFTAVDATSPIAALLIHGTKDQSVRIEGGLTGAGDQKRVDASLQDAIDYYVARNGLVAYPITNVEDGTNGEDGNNGAGGVERSRYARAKSVPDAATPTSVPDAAQRGQVSPVLVVTLNGGGHAWPGAEHKARLLGDLPHPWQASRGVLEFFASLRPEPLSKQPSPSAPR